MGAAVAQKEVLVAGEESVGRQLRLRSLISHEYVSGRLTEFDSQTGAHKFLAHDGREEWVSLAHRAYQWMSPVRPSARPNPTFVHFPGNHEAIGWKVRVYWNEMGRWYSGRVKAYDQLTKLHKVVFCDGDVRWYTIRDEAVLWIEKIPISKSQNGSPWGKSGTAPEGYEATSTTLRPSHSRKNQSTSSTTSISVSSVDSSLSGQPINFDTNISRSILSTGMTLRPRRNQKAERLVEKNPNFCIVQNRIGVFWRTDNRYYRGVLRSYNEESEKYCILYDDDQAEDVDLTRVTFYWLGPKSHSAGYVPLMKDVMMTFGAENVSTDLTPSLQTKQSDHSLLSQPRDLVGRKLFVYWDATGKKYEAEILAWDPKKRMHYLWYRDGELEWVDLKREVFEWAKESRLAKEFPAGLEQGESIPRGKAAVGWRVAVYWKDDVQFYEGRISRYNSDTGRHDVDYDDGQVETLSLSSEKIIWKACPSTGPSQAISTSSSQRTVARKSSRDYMPSPIHKRQRLPSPHSNDLAKENKADIAEDVDSSSNAIQLSLKRSSPEKSEEVEEDLDLHPVHQIPEEPLPELCHPRVARLPPQFGMSMVQVTIIARKEEDCHGESTSDDLMSHVQKYQTASSKMGRLPSTAEIKSASSILPDAMALSEYPTKEMTSQDTVANRSGFPSRNRSLQKSRGRKKGRKVTLESVLGSVSRISPKDSGFGVPPVITQGDCLDGLETNYSKNLFKSARKTSTIDAFCFLKDNIDTAAGGSFENRRDNA